jgi:hypothetical protein
MSLQASERDRPVEITPAMIEAGGAALYDFLENMCAPNSGPIGPLLAREIAELTFCAMAKAHS